MYLLLTAATLPEIAPLLSSLGLAEGENTVGGHHIYVLITGVGMVATAFSMGKQLAGSKYDLALNLGIAGSFDRTIPLGTVVHITEDHFAELGAENGDEFIPIEEMGLSVISQPSAISYQPLTQSFSVGALSALLKVKGVTVNTVHGNEVSIEKILARLQPQAESMEGAAFLYSCNEAGLAGIQVRAISNYVEKRNRDAWNIPLAIKNLNTFAEEMVKELMAIS